ncbi:MULTISPECIES: YciI family protein [Microbacterium]|uniref:YciI family protein n=1 Tax=Microbacterium TaxID=33882 RepID=UPI0010F70025|nr:YciI family protein [Microbacterium sp. 4NA327F11]MCK9916752.1 YciI family protein [Microbacteriaceae bacterium K1510]
MQFLVNVVDSRSSSATPEEMAAIDVFNQTLVDGGHWVFGAGLAHPATSVLIDGRGADPVLVDGPLVEAPEWTSGFWIIEADDEDAARTLMIEGSRACNRRLELRPLLGPPAD